MKQTRRKRLHEETCREIKAVAWEQMAEQGTAGLSLRAIARQMGMTAPALYRYYANRDALVTALIVDAFTSLAEALEAARDAVPAEDHARRLAATGLAYRDWGLAHPQWYALIFGTPIPRYHAPADITLPAAARALAVLMHVIDAAWQAGRLHLPPEYAGLPPAVEEQLETWRQWAGLSAPAAVLYLTLICWSRVHGLVSMELDHQFPAPITDPGALFRLEMAALLGQLGLR